MLDFGIAGKTAVVCAQQGLGYGCADALAAVGVNLVMNARTPEHSLPLPRAFVTRMVSR